LDINTLTGEERVPVVNKRNGKKVSVAKGIVRDFLSQEECFILSSLIRKKILVSSRIYVCGWMDGKERWIGKEGEVRGRLKDWIFNHLLNAS
jgi:hypothetical protein